MPTRDWYAEFLELCKQHKQKSAEFKSATIELKELQSHLKKGCSPELLKRIEQKEDERFELFLEEEKIAWHLYSTRDKVFCI